MREVSVTVTCGVGSEKHNHDLDYRSTLEHVHGRAESVIELHPYKSYKEQINSLLEPFIDEYNENVDNRYKAAWERYNSGITKTKPRKRDYKKMDYNYYDKHKDDTIKNPNTGKIEQLPIYRSMIIGLGDMTDRKSENITESEAKQIFSEAFEEIKIRFPDLHTLGFSIHLDESGFYHAHWDYKPVKRHQFSKGLQVTVSQDTVLEDMDFKPEQSIINGHDKAPLLFNALRNEIYHIIEAKLNKQKIMLQYGISNIKEPGKDSSKNQKLQDWQETQDKTRELQHNRNIIADTLQQDTLDWDGYDKIEKASLELENAFKKIEESKRERFNKDNVIISFNLFSQLKSYLKTILEKIKHLYHALDIAEENADFYQKKYEKLKEKYDKISQDEIDHQIKTKISAAKYEQLKENFPDEIIMLERKIQVKIKENDITKDIKSTR